ncbi:2-amino-4-hydroxy-6-hydroxymethyldihydropteridine diphosphokinase [Bremerella cremea]|uniref:2-amino-4-hydroxy-6- hydroxymethyldihydropteridine diphosphokinase n=1 Tax=Bremerella cremea TaxID=1031537 RepID=UPI0031EBB0F8
MPTILIALGANLGDRGETLHEAIDELAADPAFTLLQRSELLVTKPVGGPSGQPDFLNAAAKLATELSPDQVHQKLIDIEQQHGRVRKQRWGARKLDLDLLLYDDQVIATPSLTVPHPRMSFRKFVMQPSAEVAAEMIHPTLHTSIGELWQQLQNAPPLVEIASLPGPVLHVLCERVAAELGEDVVSHPNDLWANLKEGTPLEGILPSVVDRGSDLRNLPPGHAVRIVPWWQATSEVIAPDLVYPSEETTGPRLVIFWKRPDSTFSEIEGSWWNNLQRERLQDRLAQKVDDKVRGPRLWLDGNDIDSAVTEVAAAIQAILD